MMADTMSRWWHRRNSEWGRYVPVRERLDAAGRYAEELAQQGIALDPVEIEGRVIARSFWGAAWCQHFEGLGDYSNRLPRGRTYARNGSVIHLKLAAGAIDALVSGSQIYTVKGKVKPLPRPRWREVVEECAGRVGSLVDLLQGRIERGVMEVLARPAAGLFPAPNEIEFSCSCPDWALLCKHVAAVFYGVGARLDRDPALLFELRSVNGADLIAAAAQAGGLATTPAAESPLAGEDLGAVFGIELDPRGDSAVVAPDPPRKPSVRRSPSRRAAARARKQDDGFGEVFGPGLEVTAGLIESFGIPRSTFGNWLAQGVLARTAERGTYRTTASTLARVRAAYAKVLARRR